MLRAISPAELAAERAAEKAQQAATEAELQAAMAAIPDGAFDARAEMIEAREQAAAAAEVLKHARAVRKKIDSNPAPAAIAALKTEIETRTAALKAAEAAAVASGGDLAACVEERAAIRTQSDLLDTLESGWSQVLADVDCAIDNETIGVLDAAWKRAVERIAETLQRLKRARVDGSERRAAQRAELSGMARSSAHGPGQLIGQNATGRRMAAKREATQRANLQIGSVNG